MNNNINKEIKKEIINFFIDNGIFYNNNLNTINLSNKKARDEIVSAIINFFDFDNMNYLIFKNHIGDLNNIIEAINNIYNENYKQLKHDINFYVFNTVIESQSYYKLLDSLGYYNEYEKMRMYSSDDYYEIINNEVSVIRVFDSQNQITKWCEIPIEYGDNLSKLFVDNEIGNMQLILEHHLDEEFEYDNFQI
ncbi:hypothetical protein [Thomasclavelia cocleata]|jgi:hypothetical protein|uniref:hypothetical protein n=1 Tax=Thomasclavelia cocleata TaxID=69824 RepID=UPI00242C4D21|nr:hypothetical protein [Thomasclavelia cocleata]MCI9630123.1 hypothetical protein [Thomasclavelia cocleata]